MCNSNLIDVRSVSTHGVCVAGVPCGHCSECLSVQRSSWSFRVRAEFSPLVKKGWKMGFITLTYNDEHLPHFPREFFKDKLKFRKIPCFSRADVKTYLKSIHNALYTRYGLKDENKLRFLLCSEFGEHTQRPHYHAIFCYPPIVSDEEMFLLCSSWGNGHVFPRYISGGRDSHGYDHKPFVVNSIGAACAYVAKYVCKDLKFSESFNKADLFKHAVIDGESVPLSRYTNFHTQSKSIGFSFIKDLDYSTALDYYLNGFAFDGEDKLRSLPIYLKNKLFFNNYYVYDIDGKRLCRRVASEFAERYKQEIFDAKVNVIKEKLDVWRSKTWGTLNVSCLEMKLEFKRMLERCLDFTNYESLASFYLAYGGVNPFYCHYVDNLCDFWFSRYQCVTDGKEVVDVKFDSDVLPQWFLNSLNRFFWLGQCLDNEEAILSEKIKLSRMREVDAYRDMFKSTI